MVGRMEGKIDTVLTAQEKHGSRLAALERDRNRFAGILVGISGVLTWLGRDHAASIVALFH
jgi:hypothetical protein